MSLTAPNAATARRTDRDGSGELAGAAIAQARELTHHLVEGRIDVIRELDLGDRLQPVDAHADGSGDDAALRDRSVEHAMLAILSLEAVRYPEHAAEIPDILPQNDDARIALEHDVHRGVEGLHHVHVGHRQPSFATERVCSSRLCSAAGSFMERRARNCSRWRARCGGICLKTSSDIVAGSSAAPSVSVPYDTASFQP